MGDVKTPDAKARKRAPGDNDVAPLPFLKRFVRNKEEAPQPRQKPMRCLALGMSRTGTMSLYYALRKLGFNSYHMLECGRDAANHSFEFWEPALLAKVLGEGTKIGPKDLDTALWKYDAVTDIPCIIFVDELLEAYPDAKVILTTRDEQSWLKSIHNSIYEILSWKIWYFLKIFNRDWALEYINMLQLPLVYWTGGDIYDDEKLLEGYRKHNAHVRAAVPKDRLLEYHASQGWEPLCKFLDVPVPKDEPFPKINTGMWIADVHQYALLKRTMDALKAPPFVATFAVMVALIAVGIKQLRS